MFDFEISSWPRCSSLHVGLNTSTNYYLSCAQLHKSGKDNFALMQRKTAVVPPLFPDVVGDGSRSGSRDPSIRWKRGEMIGQGAFGTVFLGLNTDNGELMAVKQMSLEEVTTLL